MKAVIKKKSFLGFLKFLFGERELVEVTKEELEYLKKSPRWKILEEKN